MKQPRFMLAAPSSGSGKTMITCGILQILKNRGPLHQLRRGPGQPRGMRPVVHRAGRGQKAGPALQ